MVFRLPSIIAVWNRPKGKSELWENADFVDGVGLLT